MACSPFSLGFANLRRNILLVRGVPAILRKPSHPDSTIVGIFVQPPMMEDQIPGSTPGVTNVRFWVDFATLNPQPALGDQVIINGVTYEIGRPDVGLDGTGATFTLKRSGAAPYFS